jgi:spore maturation protein CgeB
LERLKRIGLTTVSYLTDDPWNPAHRARWFLRALPKYSAVFSPRRSNLHDLAHHGCDRAIFLPFAYDPSIHFKSERRATAVPIPEILFIGAGDPDRVPYAMALLKTRIHLAIFGDYWGRYSPLAQSWKGYADLETARQMTCSTPVCLCLVRRANRDGHTMRSFEAAAMGACLLCEDTDEHREIFGRDGEAVLYFHSIHQMIDRAKWLLGHEAERSRMRELAFERVTKGRNTYRDRLDKILDECSASLS